MGKVAWGSAGALFCLFWGCSSGEVLAPNVDAPKSVAKDPQTGQPTGAPARVSAAPMHVNVVRKNDPSKKVTADGPHIDWNVTTLAPVQVAPAVTGPDFTAASSSDILAFAVAATGTNRGITNAAQLNNGWAAAAANAGIAVLTNLYDASTKPDLLAYALDTPTNTRFVSGSIVLNLAGTKLYALSSNGKLYCYALPTGGPVAGAASAAATCAGWTDYASGNAANETSLWPIYDGTGEVLYLYFTTDGDKLHKVDGTTGASPWGTNGGKIASGTNAVGPPIVYTESDTTYVVFMADEIGRFIRFVDTGTAPTAATSDAYDLCGGAPASCSTANWGATSSPAADISAGFAYVASNAQVFEFPIASTATWLPTTVSKVLDAAPTARIYSSPVLDPDNNWLYTAYNNKIFKVKYPFDGGSTTNIFSASLQKSGPDASYPRAQALPYQGTVWIGTGDGTDGLAEQYGCGASGNYSGAALVGQSALTYGNYVDTPIVMDYITGNVNFGYTAGAGTTGGVVQYKSVNAAPDWVCPAGQTSIAGLACGGAGCGVGCTVAGDCVGTNQATVSCTAPTCGGTCSAGFADCNANKNADGCEVNTTNDVSNCGACGATCSTNNMYNVSCTASVCGGSCDVNFANCNANPADGCEGAATCADCCGVTCNGGTPICSGGACKATPGTTIVAYDVPATTSGTDTGNRARGMDFDVVSPIVITELGAFDSDQDGLKRAIDVTIWERNTQTVVATLNFGVGTGTLLDGSVYLPLACPLVLPAGFQGSVVTENHRSNEKAGVSATPPWTTNTGGGLITFVGTSRDGPAGAFPPPIGTGPVNQFAAGTFKFAAAP